MQGRGIAVAVLVLLAIMAGTSVTLLGFGRKLLVEAERATRQNEFEDAAVGLANLVEQAKSVLRQLSEAESLERITPLGADSGERQDAYRRLDQLMAKLAQNETVLRLGVVEQDGTALCGYDRWLGAPSGLALPRPPAVVAKALVVGAGGVALDLVARAGPGDGAEPSASLLAAIQSTRASGLVVFVELDASGQLSRGAQAAEGGGWALVEGEQVVWPRAAQLPFPLQASRFGRTVVEGDDVLSVTRVTHSPRAPWLLVVRRPLTGRLSGRIKLGLVVAALGVVLVLLLGVRGARAATLQVSLRKTEAKETELQGMFDAITDVVVVVDRELTIIRANRVAVQEHQALVEQPYAELLARRGGDSAEEAELRKLFSRGEPRHVELVGQDERVWQVAQYPIFAPDLTVSGVVEHARDVTRTKQLQVQLIQSEKLSTLGEMAAGIAHEVNNPIGVISMFAQLLHEEIRDTQGEEASALEKVKTIEEQATSVGEIVKRLLRFARKSEGERVVFDARSAVERAQSMVSQKLLRGVEIRRELPEEEVRVVGDEVQLAQVVLNLVVNANHAMEGKGTLTLAIRRRGPDDPEPVGRSFGKGNATVQRVLVSVSDTGKGIPPEKLERIFEPFFTTKPAGEGTGLGLSVGFRIIQSVGGRIWVDSTPGEGTTFTLDLPAAGPSDMVSA